MDLKKKVDELTSQITAESVTNVVEKLLESAARIMDKHDVFLPSFNLEAHGVKLTLHVERLPKVEVAAPVKSGG